MISIIISFVIVKNMMSSFALFIVVLIYLALLFLVAHLAEKKKSKVWINNPYIYALSLAVYCTAWTYYGSIGVAATSGLNYLPIYIGPIMVIPSWIYINTRIVRISRVNKISSLADLFHCDTETAEVSAPLSL